MVAAMRAAQQQYLATRSKWDLIKAKELETDVDKVLTLLKNVKAL